MQDQAPRNRAERRAAARQRGKPPRLAVPPLQRQSQNGPHDQDTGIGAQSAEGAEVEYANQVADAGPAPKRSHHAARPAGASGASADVAPAVSHKKGAGKEARIRDGLATYYALAGLAVSRVDETDGQLVAAYAVACADSWVAAGKANPQIMRALELITVAGPYTAIIMVHAQLATDIMKRHGTSPLALFRSPGNTTPGPTGPQRGAAMPPSGQPGQQNAAPEPAPLPYQPVGANAPTEAPAAPPVYADEGLRVYPDEGIPAEIDVALRQMARQSGRPYEELRQEAMVELAQMRMAQNGHQASMPGALGAPIVRE